MADEKLLLEAFPGKHLSVLLFKDVTNAKELQTLVISGKLEPEAALINASTVGDILPLRVAAHKTYTAHVRGKMITRNVYSELVFSLSPSKHISESLKRYGIGEDATHVLVARYNATAEEMAALGAQVKGTRTPLSELASLLDEPTLHKYLKLSQEELAVVSTVNAAVARIAAREVL